MCFDDILELTQNVVEIMEPVDIMAIRSIQTSTFLGNSAFCVNEMHAMEEYERFFILCIFIFRSGRISSVYIVGGLLLVGKSHFFKM